MVEEPQTATTKKPRHTKLVATVVLSLASIVLTLFTIVSTSPPIPTTIAQSTKTECSSPAMASSLVDINGTWSLTQSDTELIRGWTWHPGPNSDLIMTSNKYYYYTTWHRINPPSPPNEALVVKPPTPLPAYPQVAPGTVSSVLQSDNTSLVFYGSSHLREIFFAMMRLEYGMDMLGKLPENITYLPSGTKHMEKTCDHGNRGFRTGFFGVDMEKCGPPARRIIEELSPNVAFGFKTFLHTPDADAHFLEFLNQTGLRHPDIIIMDAGIWGPRGNKLGGSAQTIMTPLQEWQYYMEWIHRSFPQSHLLLVHEGHVSILERFQAMAQNTSSPQQHVTILRKDILLQKMPPVMPCEHGCAGPIINTLAVLIIEWLQQRQSMAHC